MIISERVQDIEFRINKPVTLDEFAAVLKASTLAERRPVDDLQCLQAMLKNANLTISAWHRDELVGIARSITDFSFCCYVSDLAVAVAFQKRGIGKALLQHTKAQLRSTCMLILLSAPAAVDYYPRVGFRRHPNAYYLRPQEKVR